MNEIERAIKHFTSLQKRYTTQHNGEQCALVKTAISALRAQEKEPCVDCSGIVYRQTASGKIIPADQRCGGKIVPPCYQPDGDGCAYQIYGDNNDEPIDLCKECPLCYADKERHKKPENKPLTCRDCEYAAYEWSKSNKNTDTCHCKKWKRGMKQTDFCSYAERKPERSEGNEIC